MTGGITKTDWIIAVFHSIPNDLIGRFPKWDGVVLHIAHPSYYQCLDIIEHPISLDVHHHPVNMIEVFVQVFNKKNFTRGIESRTATA